MRMVQEQAPPAGLLPYNRTPHSFPIQQPANNLRTSTGDFDSDDEELEGGPAARERSSATDRLRSRPQRYFGCPCLELDACGGNGRVALIFRQGLRNGHPSSILILQLDQTTSQL